MFRSVSLLTRITAFVLALALSTVALTATPASAGPNDPSFIYGKATDAITGVPLNNVCVVLGPALLTCIARTNATGDYRIDFPNGDIITSEQELHFLARDQNYQDYNSPHFVVKGATLQNAPMLKVGATPPSVG